jgi:hypothetical protein
MGRSRRRRELAEESVKALAPEELGGGSCLDFGGFHVSRARHHHTQSLHVSFATRPANQIKPRSRAQTIRWPRVVVWNVAFHTTSNATFAHVT